MDATSSSDLAQPLALAGRSEQLAGEVQVADGGHSDRVVGWSPCIDSKFAVIGCSSLTFYFFFDLVF